ncbi:DUF5131 family protein [Faecalibaculum rodentium]|uniref:Bacteriophage protein gp37 n=1 Tax=Faecalibaculum rodentium TaxID=1702221 RepID=A0A1Q9YK63_9FIRM|nr:DUF5131 family protein [Faecalibaculum rodentium]OLU44958.1 hypothetical protein BO223_06510 [Faecalibaculum rodentium]
MRDISWNPWHGCHPFSAGCRNCFMRRADLRHGRNPDEITRSKTMFNLPLKKKRDGSWKVPSGSQMSVCFNSDFFLEDADAWRQEAWDIMRQRPDVRFLIPTKRIHRIRDCLPPDWHGGWPHISIAVSVENQTAARQRLDLFLTIPCQHRLIFAAPLLEELDLYPWLKTGGFQLVSVAGESGLEARPCDFDWMEKIYLDCRKTRTPFAIHQTGRYFIRNGHLYTIRKKDQFQQAHKAHSWLRQQHRLRQTSLFEKME